MSLWGLRVKGPWLWEEEAAGGLAGAGAAQGAHFKVTFNRNHLLLLKEMHVHHGT